MLEIKKKVYEAAAATNIKVTDYLPLVEEYPYIMVTTSNSIGTRLKNAKGNAIYFTLDIFSNKKGEKEIYDIAAAIDREIEKLFILGQVVTIDKEQFSIINDTNPIVKHGVLIYKINTMEV